jgi:hypothetical protein
MAYLTGALLKNSSNNAKQHRSIRSLASLALAFFVHGFAIFA